jgi:hypothetical protein
VQRYRRGKAVLAAYGGKECEGIDEREEECRSEETPCCDPNKVVKNECQRTCKMVRENQAAGVCAETCVCKPGMAWDEVLNKCVAEQDCQECKLDDGRVMQTGTSHFDYDNCVAYECVNSALSNRSLTIEDDLQPCTNLDKTLVDEGQQKVKHPTLCCYTATSKPCQPAKHTYESVQFANGSLCVLDTPVKVTRCQGECFSFSAPIMVDITMGSTLSHDNNCKCCAPKEVEPQGVVERNCKNAASLGKVFVRYQNAKSCHCIKTCKEGGN